MNVTRLGTLTEDEELVIAEIIGCGIAVHRALGPGYGERIYKRAMCLELKARDIAFEVERVVEVVYRDEVLGTHRIDLIVQSLVVLELKAVERLDAVYKRQVVAYLKASGLRAGLLMNFNAALLKDGLQRVIVSSSS